MYARPAPVVPYEGGPVPTGYHVEERPRKGLIIAGSLVAGIPWALGLSIVVGTEYPNKSSWLLLPALGPWITLASRSDRKDCTYDSAGTGSYCVDDGSNSAIRTILVLDGLMQVAGTTMLIIGLTSPTKVVARDFVGSLHFTPATVGNHGYGGFVTGAF